MREPYFSVKVAGQTVLSGGIGAQGLHSVTVNDADGQSDTARITLDDTDGRIYLPQKNDPVIIIMGQSKDRAQEVFSGFVTSVTSSGSGQGRMISVSADSADTSGKLKEAMQKSWKDQSIEKILSDAAKHAGVNQPRIDPALGAIIRTNEVADGESFMELGQRLAKETGGKFKIYGPDSVLWTANFGLGSGVSVAWGKNLHAWSISPRETRPVHASHEVRYFDLEEGKWVTEKVEGVKDEAQAKARAVGARATKEEAKEAARAEKAGAERAGGSGSITVEGDPAIFAGCSVSISGTRPGIDGTYRVNSCSHSFDASGFVTTAQLEQPQDGAGVDER